MKKKFLIVPIWIVSERTIKLRIFKKNQNIMNYNCRKKGQSLKLIFTILLLIISSLVYSQNINSGLVAYYSFNGNAKDESGNGYDGTVKGATLTTDRFGNPNNAYSLNGANQYIKLPSSINIQSNLSISFWIKTDLVDNDSWYKGTFLIDRDICGISRDWSVSIGRGGKIIFNTGHSNADSPLYSKTDINNNVWRQIVIVRDASSVKKKIYVDGVLNSEEKFEESYFANNNINIYIGASYCETSDHDYYKGNIDDIKIFNRILTENEIKSDFLGINDNVYNSDLLKAQQAFSEGKYLLVLELLKDFPVDDPLYFDAVALMNQAIAKLSSNSTQSFVTVSGSINCGCSKAISGYVVFEDMNTRLSVGKCRITPDGYYCIVLPSGKIYSYYIDSKDFYPSSRIIDFTTPNQTPNYKDNITLVSYEEMKEQQASVRINNIFFDFNESKLKSESYLELDRLYKFLNDNSDISVEISGHTDNIGSDEYNITLSNARANAVKDYLISKGISGNRIMSKGYGKSKPVATNDTDEGRQLNRRVEFKIIK
ncbi:MAG TPA: OmpA family protein [Ignavibacteria bacterium]